MRWVASPSELPHLPIFLSSGANSLGVLRQKAGPRVETGILFLAHWDGWIITTCRPYRSRNTLPRRSHVSPCWRYLWRRGRPLHRPRSKSRRGDYCWSRRSTRATQGTMRVRSNSQRVPVRFQMSPLRYFIANEENAVGRLAPALGDADSCIREAERDATARNRTEIISQCQALRTALHARVGQLTVRIPDPAPSGLHVTVATQPLDPALYGVASVVTPGTVVVEADATDRAHFRREVQIAPGATVEVVLNLPPGPRHETPSTAAQARVDSSAPSASPRAPPPAAEPPPASSGTAAPRIAGGLVALLGLAAVGVGAGLYADTSGAFSRCQVHLCTVGQEPRSEDLAAVVLLWGGGALAVVGAALFLAAPVFARHHDTRGATLWLDPRGSAGVMGRL